MNRAIIEADGQPPEHHKLYDPGVVRDAISRARAHYDLTEDIAGTVAILAARLSKHQPFRETNHRTAHAIAHRFLTVNGFKALAPDDDIDLTDILAKDRDPYRGIDIQVEELTELFRRRIEEDMEKLTKGPRATQTGVHAGPSESSSTEPASVPSPEVAAKQDPLHTRQEFLRDLDRATRRVPEQPS